MSKSAAIMALHAKGKTTREIACAVYQISTDAPHAMLKAPMAYVRVVTRQRKGGGQSDHDKALRLANPDKVRDTQRRAFQKRYSDPQWRRAYLDKHNAQERERYATDPSWRAQRRAKASACYYERNRLEV